jgi:hypothetical protein
VWKADWQVNHKLVDLNEQSTVEWQEKILQGLLYGVENLRKRREEGQGEGEEQVEAEE